MPTIFFATLVPTISYLIFFSMNLHYWIALYRFKQTHASALPLPTSLGRANAIFQFYMLVKINLPSWKWPPGELFELDPSFDALPPPLERCSGFYHIVAIIKCHNTITVRILIIRKLPPPPPPWSFSKNSRVLINSRQTCEF